MDPAEPDQPIASASVSADTALAVDIVWSPHPGELREQRLSLPSGSTLARALADSGWFEAARLPSLTAGIWGRVKPLDTLLREGDRVEVYRPLTVDPKEARRQRYRATGRRIVTRHRPLGRKA